MGNIDKITVQDLIEIEKSYLSGESIKLLSKKYSCRYSDMSDLLKENDIKVRGKGIQVNKENYRTNIKYTLNENYFNDIDSYEKAYWLGFLYADGCVRNEYRKRTLDLCLKSEDSYHINNLSRALGSNATARKRVAKIKDKEYSAHRCCWNSKKLVDALEKHGCVQNKSLILEFPKELKKELISDFIRGYFDGDGCVYCYNYEAGTTKGVQIIGTDKFCKELSTILSDFNIKNTVYKPKNKNYFEIRIYGKEYVKNFYVKMYKNAKDNTCLKRKKD